MEESYQPFNERVDQSIEAGDFTKIVQYLVKNPKVCSNDP